MSPIWPRLYSSIPQQYFFIITSAMPWWSYKCCTHIVFESSICFLFALHKVEHGVIQILPNYTSFQMYAFYNIATVICVCSCVLGWVLARGRVERAREFSLVFS